MDARSLLLIALVVALGITATVGKSPPMCHVDGVSYQNGEDIPDPDPCTSCFCDVAWEENNGRVCMSMACGWPRCPGGHTPVSVPGACCPTCPDTNTCIHAGVEYEEGDKVPYHPDPCAVCTCDPTSALPNCNFMPCSISNCGKGVSPVSRPGVCCPVCPE